MHFVRFVSTQSSGLTLNLKPAFQTLRGVRRCSRALGLRDIHSSSHQASLRAMAAAAATNPPSLLHGDVFWLDTFALRQWDDENYQGTRIEYDKVLDVQWEEIVGWGRRVWLWC